MKRTIITYVQLSHECTHVLTHLQTLKTHKHTHRHTRTHMCTNTRKHTQYIFAQVILGEAPCMATAWVTEYWQLLVLRTLTGVSIGGALPLVYSLLGDLFFAQQVGVCVCVLYHFIFNLRFPLLGSNLPSAASHNIISCQLLVCQLQGTTSSVVSCLSVSC